MFLQADYEIVFLALAANKPQHVRYELFPQSQNMALVQALQPHSYTHNVRENLCKAAVTARSQQPREPNIRSWFGEKFLSTYCKSHCTTTLGLYFSDSFCPCICTFSTSRDSFIYNHINWQCSLADKNMLTHHNHGHKSFKLHRFTPFHQDCPMEMATSHPVIRNQGWVKPACAPKPSPAPAWGSAQVPWGSAQSPHHHWPRSKAEALVRPPSHELHRHGPCGCQVAMSSSCLMGSRKEWQQHGDNQPWTEIKEQLSTDVRMNSCFSRLFFILLEKQLQVKNLSATKVKAAAAKKLLFAFCCCCYLCFLSFSLLWDKFSSVRDFVVTQICWLKNAPKGLCKTEKYPCKSSTAAPTNNCKDILWWFLKKNHILPRE